MISFPKKIQIETSILCNSHCVFCPHNELQRGPKQMEEWVWKKIIDESRGRGIIYRPFLINEPFVDLKLPDVLEYIKKDNTAKIELNSNGHFSLKADLKRIVSAGIDWIRFSIDGFTEETFKKSGRGGKFDTIIKNVHAFIDERNRQKSECYIEVRMIDINVTEEEKAEFIEYWNKYADKGTVTQLYSWPWSGQTTHHPAPCPKVADEMFFLTDGSAVLCCWDAFGKGVIGNVKDLSIEEIWSGEPMQQYKKWLAKGERDKIELCSRCDAYKTYDFSDWKGY